MEFIAVGEVVVPSLVDEVRNGGTAWVLSPQPVEQQLGAECNDSHLRRAAQGWVSCVPALLLEHTCHHLVFLGTSPQIEWNFLRAF